MMRILFLSLFLAGCQPLLSQTCCSGGVPLSNNLGLPNEGGGSLTLGLNYDYNNLNTLNVGSDKLDDDSRLRNTNSLLLNLGYSFTDRLSVESLFTWVNQTRTIAQFGNENFTETTGLGDAVLLIKYAFPEVLGGSSVLNLGAGGKIPLGKSDLTTEEGVQLNADLQPGSGAWDALGWMSISKNLGFRPSATLSGSVTYRYTGKNDSYLNNTAVYEFGNVLQANVGYTDQFLLFNTVFNPGLIVKYRKADSDEIDTTTLPNTGGEWIFIRPELLAKITPALTLSTRLEIPIYSYVDGTQLTPTLRFSAGLSYTFKKSTVLNP
ncbi:transporter [Aggregatimonas sangjinii]|uniref:Transporter n=1 Tax=Aggregatimonas sangjinii TaxID=2583587 RepID=A0A5B7SP02_9FLAO|nr:transporter [Aggregatimonas sangjinii]QCW98750.1 transporter [Aggregatimonas sangjinii]